MESWCDLKELKESFPIEIAEYVTAIGVQDELAFTWWWFPFTLQKRDRVIESVKSQTKKKTHKFGIRVPANVQEAYDVDLLDKNQYWRDVIAKEMKNVMIAFDVLIEGQNLEPGCEFIRIFDVKTDFTRKARFVVNGSRTRDPDQSTYAGVVSRETVRIALT